MNKLLIALLATTAMLTACNNNVGGVPEHVKTYKDLKFLTFNYPQNGVYISKDKTKSLTIFNQQIDQIKWESYTSVIDIYSSDSVDLCVEKMLKKNNKNESEIPIEKYFVGRNCKSGKDSNSITITNTAESQPITETFYFDHKVNAGV